MINSLIYWLHSKENENMILQWEKEFPNKCIICSYHNFAYTNGMTHEVNPPKHTCKYTHNTHKNESTTTKTTKQS